MAEATHTSAGDSRNIHFDLNNFKFSNLRDGREKPHGKEYLIDEIKSRAIFRVKIFEGRYALRANEEIGILEKLRGSPNIIKMLGSVTGIGVNGSCILYEYIQGTIWSVFRMLKKVDDVKTYSHQLLLALDSCHSKKIIHRCINFDSLLVNIERKHLKLAGWDHAMEHTDGDSYETDANLIYYRSPELLIGLRKHDFAVDLWAAGCIIASLAFLKVRVFDGSDNDQQLSKMALILGGKELLEFIQQQNVPLRESVSKEIERYGGTGFQILVTHKCRRTATKEAIDLVKNLLVYNPTRRLSAKGALNHALFSTPSQRDSVDTAFPTLVQKMKRMSTESEDDRQTSDKDGYLRCLLGGILGKGGYATVYYAREMESGREFAVKSLKVPLPPLAKREVEILNALRGHPHIVPFLGVIESPENEPRFLIFKCIGVIRWDDLYRTFTRQDIQRYIYQLLLALDACHSRGIIHRDVKPSNLLIDHLKRHLYLADWGLAKFYREGGINSLFVVTRPYKGPELLLGYMNYDYSLDMWSVGCILASALFRRRYMFFGSTDDLVLLEIVKVFGHDCLFDFCRKYGTKLSPSQSRLLHYSRPVSWTDFINNTNRDVVSRDGIDLLSKLLVFDHKQRITAADALQHDYFKRIAEFSPNTSF